MKNEIGKKNMVFGFSYFITTLLLGLFLAFKAKTGGAAWHESETHEMLVTAHVHGNLESVLNIVVGYILCQLEVSAGLAGIVSILLLVAAIFHSGMLYLTGLGLGVAVNLAPIGALSLIAAMAMMAYLVAIGFKKSS
ncbi:MAG: hypothetical protein HZC13_04255 [Nitrospirae bacterium]|nr:hypothetical protein [Nitrospirota bacterium]